MRNTKTKLWIYLFLLPAIIIFLVFFLVPIITIFITSFTKWDGFNSPIFVGFKNFLNLFGKAEFLISLKNLLYWSLIAAFLHVGYGAMELSIMV